MAYSETVEGSSAAGALVGLGVGEWGVAGDRVAVGVGRGEADAVDRGDGAGVLGLVAGLGAVRTPGVLAGGGVASAAAVAVCVRASSALAETGTLLTMVGVSESGGTFFPPMVISNASGRPVRTCGPSASAGTV